MCDDARGSRMVIVCKFGGTSVGGAPAMREAAAIVEQALPQAPLVVLSAMSGTTDGLFRAARLAERGQLAEARAELETIFERHRAAAAELITDALPALREELDRHRDELEVLLHGVSLLRELTRRTLDAIVGHGELLSSVIFVRLLERRGTPVDWFDVRRVLRTEALFGAAAPQRPAITELCRTELLPLLVPGRAVVTQGYLGATEQGHATTLGRGGSDYSATLLGAAVAAGEVQIWTDVEGVLTADPRLVPDALPIEELSFAEAAELAAFGAKVLHPATIQPAVEARIPVTVRHTQRPTGRFTTIRDHVRSGRPVTALATRGPVTVLTVSSTRMLAQSGFLARLFEVFGRFGVSVDLVATAEVSVSLTVEADEQIAELCAALRSFATVEISERRAIVAVVGERLKQTAGLAARIFVPLAGINVEMISMGANEINLSLVVEESLAPEAVRKLHAALFPPAAGTVRAP
jgi:aspartate kinase